jgi:uncharacterized protein
MSNRLRTAKLPSAPPLCSRGRFCTAAVCRPCLALRGTRRRPRSRPNPTILTGPNHEKRGFATLEAAVARAAQLLPHQGILENFVHHNPLRSFEHFGFSDAVQRVTELESYVSPGARALSTLGVDPRKRAHEATNDLSAAFLDRGAAKWAPSFRDRGFLFFYARLERLGVAPWRKVARGTAQRVLGTHRGDEESALALSEAILRENLAFFGVDPAEHDRAVGAMLLELRGWAGMFQHMQTHPTDAPADTRVHLLEFCAVQSALLRASVEALALESGWRPAVQPYDAWLRSVEPRRSFLAPDRQRQEHHQKQGSSFPHASVRTASAVAFADQNGERREAMEADIEEAFLHAIDHHGAATSAATARTAPALQLYTCIDDREGSLRRHLEQEAGTVVGGAVETFGVAGFFGLPIRYKAAGSCGDGVIHGPEGQAPSAVLVEEEDRAHTGELGRFRKRRRVRKRLQQWWETASFSPLGSLALSVLFPVSLVRLWGMGFAPAASHSIRSALEGALMPQPHTDYESPYSPSVAATLLARTFASVGASDRFAPLVVILGHGAVSANNPFAAAYNCGACSGHEGGPNARLFARMANDPSVRERLRVDHGIWIPDQTVVVGGMHNTTSDELELYDQERVPEAHHAQLEAARVALQRALGRNAIERCNRFLLAKKVDTPEGALKHVQTRSVDPAEVRPELNHSSNAAVILGRRALTQGSFFDRRAFLPSYDPFTDDDAGTQLEAVLGPALAVCSGINLEYLFSAVAVERHGAGTKTPLNVVGNIGVLQGTAGDLRPGLPSQMTEMHAPVRALFVIDAPLSRVEAVLERRSDLARLVHNEWVRCIVRDPETGDFFRHERGGFAAVDRAAIGAKNLPSFAPQREHGLRVAHREDLIYWGATAAMLAACAGPAVLFSETAMNPHGPLTALAAGSLAIPVLAFSRRYMHGEFLFGRFAVLSVGLLLGFNLVATAPTLVQALPGWTLFGFASAFLIGSYNERPSVRNNASFAFAAYRISDMALLTAAAFLAAAPAVAGSTPPDIVAGALMLAALYKSSQFPLTALFARSMEGPTPTSALGYAGLSAHIGVVLLASTTSLWFPLDWARIVLGSLGLYTAVSSGLVSKIRADRKGALAYATSSTLGLIYVTLALGYPDLALAMSLGHSAFRINQILRAPGVIGDTQRMRDALGESLPWPRRVPDLLYETAWRLHRIDTDLHLVHVLHRVANGLRLPQQLHLTKWSRWAVVSGGLTVAGLPFTPLSHAVEEYLLYLLPVHPAAASAIMLGHAAVSILTMRFLLVSVLSNGHDTETAGTDTQTESDP